MANTKREDLDQFIEFLELKYQAKLNMAKANRLRRKMRLNPNSLVREGLSHPSKHKVMYSQNNLMQ